MQDALLIGLSRQTALERQLDVVANNIANLNTTGYKSDGALFEQYIPPSDGAASTNGSQTGSVADRATWIDMSQGALDRTGNPLDVAIQGKGFLVVQTANGERYTRNGALQVNASGELVTGEGDAVLGENGPITFQPGDHGITVSKDGTISAQSGTNTADSVRGKLRLVSFTNAGQLQKDGSGYFAPADGVSPDPDTQSKIEQGAIEKSNVNPVLEMTRMIEVTRSYTQLAAMLSQQTDVQSTAIDKLAAMPN